MRRRGAKGTWRGWSRSRRRCPAAWCRWCRSARRPRHAFPERRRHLERLADDGGPGGRRQFVERTPALALDEAPPQVVDADEEDEHAHARQPTEARVAGDTRQDPRVGVKDVVEV